jgi:hypothetical protein
MKIIIMLLLLIFTVVGLTVSTVVDDTSRELIYNILLFLVGIPAGIFVFGNSFKKD